jgi:ABC-type glycerol-3-phosphate transport system substrate-binding protein
MAEEQITTVITIQKQDVDFGDHFAEENPENKQFALESALERFKKQYPDLKFDVKSVNGVSKEKLQNMLKKVV